METRGYDDDGTSVPIEQLTPEDRCSFLEETKQLFIDMGLQPDDFFILVSYITDLKDLK